MSNPEISSKPPKATVNVHVSGPGKDGYTPQRGKDYWTEDDKHEIQNYIRQSGRDNWINVVSMGADNTGVHDVSEIIQTLISELSDRPATIYFPSGYYLLSNKIVVNKSNVTLRGNAATIFASEEILHECLLWDSSELWCNILIEDLHFIGVADNRGQGFIKLQGARNVTIKNCIFENCGGVAIANTNGNLLENFTCYGCSFLSTSNGGILLRPIKNVLIDNNVFENINGYSSSEPAHPIYLRADGIAESTLEDVYVTNNTIRNCIVSDYGGKHAIKVVSNTSASPNYYGKNVWITCNNIDKWTSGIHVGRIDNVTISNNVLLLETKGVNGQAILIEHCSNSFIHDNNIVAIYSTMLTSGEKAYCCGIDSLYNYSLSVRGNKLSCFSYYAMRVVGYVDTETTDATPLEYIDIEDNIVDHRTDQTDGYTIMLSGDMNNVNVSSNKITCCLRGVHCGSNTFNGLTICGNTLKHIKTELGNSGTALSTANATKTNFVQSGNIITGFKYTNATAMDIVENLTIEQQAQARSRIGLGDMEKLTRDVSGVSGDGLIKTAIIKSDHYEDLVECLHAYVDGATTPIPEELRETTLGSDTLRCINMTYEEARGHLLSGGILEIMLMAYGDSLVPFIDRSVQIYHSFPENVNSDAPNYIRAWFFYKINNINVELFWTENGIEVLI